MGNTHTFWVSREFDYSPFGMVMPGRNWQAGSADGYGFGFNNQKNVPEINKSHHTSEFWEYDTRTGRRWNIDINFKAYSYKSPYACLQNNPIIFIDPLGSTDYFNHRGKFMGSDGVNNGDSKMALNKATTKLLKADLKKGNAISTSCSYYRNLIPTYTTTEINAMKNTFSTAKSSKKEEGFAVGAKSTQEGIKEKYIVNSPSGTDGSVNATPANNAIKNAGDDNLYDVHLHPVKIKYTTGSNHIDKTSLEPSNRDISNYSLKDNIYTFDQPSITLGYTYDDENVSEELLRKAVENPGQWIDLPLGQIKAVPTISFYDEAGTIGVLNFNRFVKANRKIQKFNDKQKKD